jgi:hypothetical protein
MLMPPRYGLDAAVLSHDGLMVKFTRPMVAAKNARNRRAPFRQNGQLH